MRPMRMGVHVHLSASIVLLINEGLLLCLWKLGVYMITPSLSYLWIVACRSCACMTLLFVLQECFAQFDLGAMYGTQSYSMLMTMLGGVLCAAYLVCVVCTLLEH